MSCGLFCINCLATFDLFAAERRKMEAMKKEGAVEPKKRRTNRFDE